MNTTNTFILTKEHSITTLAANDPRPEPPIHSLSKFMAKLKDRLLQLASTPASQAFLKEWHNKAMEMI